MGTYTTIARRLPDGRIQYGGVGLAGECKWLGETLDMYYSETEDVEYLFSLGQMKQIGGALQRI